MNASNPYNFLDQRRPVSHIAFIVFSLLAAIILGYTKKYFSPELVPASIFFMIFVQIEVFIYFGNLLFARLSFDRKPGEITRIVLFRLVLFLAACLLASLIIFITMLYSIQLIKGESLSGVLNRFIHYEFRNWFKSTIAGLSTGAIIFIFLLWQTALKGEQRLREENLIFQNETLKNQINPHFLFNSLNTLSSLLTTRPDVAEQ